MPSSEHTPGVASLGAQLTLGVAYFGSSAMMRVCDPMLPVLSEQFHATVGQASATVSGYALSYGLTQLLMGPLGDRYGKERVVGFAALACVLGNLLAVAAWRLDLLVLARVLSGAAAAGIIPLVLAWVGDTVAYEHRQAVLARFLTSSILGMIAGQWFSGVVTQWLGWRSVFGTLALLFAAAGASVVVQQARGGRRPERRADTLNHLQQIRAVLGRPWARVVLAAVAFDGALAFPVVAFLPSYLAQRHGLALGTAAAIVALYGAGGFVYSFGAKRFLRALGEPGQSICGGALLGSSWISLALVDAPVAVALSCLAAGTGYYMLHNTMTTHATQMAPEARGTALGLYAFSMFGGISVGVGLAGMLVDYVGFTTLFAACGGGLLTLGVVFAAAVRRRS